MNGAVQSRLLGERIEGRGRCEGVNSGKGGGKSTPSVTKQPHLFSPLIGVELPEAAARVHIANSRPRSGFAIHLCITSLGMALSIYRRTAWAC